MAKLSKVDAARVIGVSRQTLYAYIKHGRVSANPDGTIDTAELLRAGFALQSIDSQVSVQIGHNLTDQDRQIGQKVSTQTDVLTQLTTEITALRRERDLLQRELADAKTEKTRLLTLLEHSQQQQQRLLEAGQQRSGMLAHVRRWLFGTPSSPAGH